MISKKGVGTETRFIIGLILAVMTIIFFARCAAPFIKGEDKSIKSFYELADVIEGMNKGELTDDVETSLIQLSSGEMILFFDKNENFTLRFYEEDPGIEKKYPALALKSFEDEDYSFDSFYNTFKNDEDNKVYVFSKPAESDACGDKACIVFCRDAKITNKNSYEIKIDEGKTTKKINGEDKVFVVRCVSPRIHTFDNINKFYRKPFLACYDKKCNANERGISIFNGAYVIRSSFGEHKKSYLEKGAFKSGITPSKVIKNVKDAYSLPEDADNEQTLKFVDSYFISLFIEEYQHGSKVNTQITADTYLYLQKYKDNSIAICYTSPCLSNEDKIYLSWDSKFTSCFAGDCAGLQGKIDNVARLSKNDPKVVLSFSRNGNEIVVNENERTFSFNQKNLFFLKKPDGSESSLSKVSFSSVRTSTGSKVALIDGSDKYYFEKVFIETIPKDKPKDWTPKLYFLAGSKIEE